jgi:hypothetical protein
MKKKWKKLEDLSNYLDKDQILKIKKTILNLLILKKKLILIH